MDTIVELEIIIIALQILTIPAVIFGKAAYLDWQSRRWEREDRKRVNQNS